MQLWLTKCAEALAFSGNSRCQQAVKTFKNVVTKRQYVVESVTLKMFIIAYCSVLNIQFSTFTQRLF